MPLFAHPAFSATWLIPLSADSLTQLKIFTTFHVLLALAGAYWLACDYFTSARAAVVCAMVFGLNGAMVGYLWAGHLPVAGIAYLPWVILFLRWSATSPGWGLVVGACVAVAALMCLHYTTMFLFVIVPVWLSARALRADHATRHNLFVAGVCAAGVIAALAGTRLLLALQIVVENPWDGASRATTRTDFPARLLPILFGTPELSPAIDSLHAKTPHEYLSYVGIAMLVLAGLSLRRGWRWWHTLFVTCLLLALGNVAWYHPSRWLESIPLLSSMRVPTRWRLLGMLGLALAAGQGTSSLSESRRWLRLGLPIVGVLEIGLHAYFVLANTLRLPVQEIAGPPIRDQIVQFQQWDVLGDARKPSDVNSAHYRFTHHGFGVVSGYESFIARSQPQTGALGYGHRCYRGEFGPADRVRQVVWSPNRIVLEGPPGTRAWINQNRGSYWLIDGQRPYRDLPVVDRTTVTSGVIPQGGRLEFRILPPYVAYGYWLQGAGALAIICGVAWVWMGRPRSALRPISG
ncbi:MAG: hypothetical protein K2Y37_02495 [Pirellulales bacterium]|nr:hypothetical protein [Pirellulales bacterium]